MTPPRCLQPNYLIICVKTQRWNKNKPETIKLAWSLIYDLTCVFTAELWPFCEQPTQDYSTLKNNITASLKKSLALKTNRGCISVCRNNDCWSVTETRCRRDWRLMQATSLKQAGSENTQQLDHKDKKGGGMDRKNLQNLEALEINGTQPQSRFS